MQPLTYFVIDKHDQNISQPFATKVEAKQHRNKLQALTKNGLPEAEYDGDGKLIKDHRSVESNWRFKVVSAND